jgi:hypothetical protein
VEVSHNASRSWIYEAMRAGRNGQRESISCTDCRGRSEPDVCGTVAGVLQDGRERCPGAERDSIVLDSICERVRRSEQGNMRGQSQRNERAHL